ncbi:MAG: LapA family protein [Anaerolineales bacterium]|nr:LapA family protein [Anaerolineales bacterium]
MATVYLIFALVISVIAVIFALQNPDPVTVSFLAWEVDGSLSLVLLVTLAIGAVIGLLVLAPSTIKHTLAASGHRKRIGLLEKELDEHKARVAELQKPVPVPPPSLPVEPPKPVTPPPDQPKPQ